MRSFLALPRELRDTIYHYALVSGDALQISCATVRTLEKCDCEHWLYSSSIIYHYCNLPFTDITRAQSSTRPNVSLLRTCHQIHAEAAKLLYEGNTFHFGDQRCEVEDEIVRGRISRIRSSTIAENFLRNLPAVHLLHIKSLSLGFFSTHWPRTALWDFAAQSLRLEELTLSFDVTLSDIGVSYWPDVRWLPWEGDWNQKFSEPELLEDVHALTIFDMCKIRNLKGLAINLKIKSVLGYTEAMDRTVRSAAAFCSLLQSKMLNDEANLELIESTFHGQIALAHALTGSDTQPFALHIHADAGKTKSISHRQPRTHSQPPGLIVTEQFQPSTSDARGNFFTCPICSGEAFLAASWEAKLDSMQLDLTDLHIQSWPEGLDDTAFLRHIFGNESVE